MIDFRKRRRQWSPVETVAFASALVLACCWVYDGFVLRPALDRLE